MNRKKCLGDQAVNPCLSRQVSQGSSCWCVCCCSCKHLSAPSLGDDLRSKSAIRLRGQYCTQLGSGQEVCFGPSRPDPGRNAREQDGTRTSRDGPHLRTWMGPKYCKTKHVANLDGTPSNPGWDLDGPRIGPRRGSGWHPQRQ